MQPRLWVSRRWAQTPHRLAHASGYIAAERSSSTDITVPCPMDPKPDTLSADLRRLEEIVRALESEDTDLDSALALFEEGVARLRGARDRLGEAEARVQKVLEDAAGHLTITDFRE